MPNLIWTVISYQEDQGLITCNVPNYLTKKKIMPLVKGSKDYYNAISKPVVGHPKLVRFTNETVVYEYQVNLIRSYSQAQNLNPWSLNLYS